MDEVNRMFNKLIANDPNLSKMFSSPAYRYYSRQGSKDRYFRTCEKINHKGKPKYVAGIYRYIKTKKQFKLVKKVGFAKKYKADKWALDMKNKEQKLKTTSPEIA